MKTILFSDYYKRLKGCFQGKTVGGTLGQPFEGQTQTNNVNFYDPVPTKMVANDDLDLQVVWLECIRESGLPVNRRCLADAWVRNVNFAFDEYGIALRNIKMGVYPPLSGYFNNEFYAGMGAAIRTELWAALAPGDPALAVALAAEDCCVDHYSDGYYAALFFAAIQSAAFLEGDIHCLIETGLSFLPDDCRFTLAIRDTISWWNETHDVMVVRGRILEKYYCANWTDVLINCSFIILAWLYGEGDFNHSICCAVNLGYDTDCTAGTLAAILGIINPDGIGEEWLKPIGNDIVLSWQIVQMHDVISLNDMMEKISEMAIDVTKFYHSEIMITHTPDVKRHPYAAPWTDNYKAVEFSPLNSGRESLVSVQPFILNLIYPEKVSLDPGVPGEFTAVIRSNGADTACNLTLHVPDGWVISQSDFKLELSSKQDCTIRFTVTPPLDEYVIPSYNPLSFCFRTDNNYSCVKAGMPISLPWKRLPLDLLEMPSAEAWNNAETLYSSYSVQIVPKGKFAYMIDFKVYTELEINIPAMGMPLQLWVDGDLLMTHNGKYMTPSVHRYEESAQLLLSPGWHTAVVLVDNTGATYDRMFFCIGNMPMRIWLDQVEWRKSVPGS